MGGITGSAYVKKGSNQPLAAVRPKLGSGPCVTVMAEGSGLMAAAGTFGAKGGLLAALRSSEILCYRP